MLHGEATVQIWIDLMGSAEAGPNVVGTASGPLLDGEDDGDPCGELDAWAEGVDDVCATGDPLPRPDRTLSPTIPSRRMITTATAPGTNHGGLSARIPPPPPTGGRGTVGRRMGGGTVGVREGGGAVGV